MNSPRHSPAAARTPDLGQILRRTVAADFAELRAKVLPTGSIRTRPCRQLASRGDRPSS